ncbi:MAG: exported protein of unknown function [Phycisphaerales bacterium]|nr:exported protein of unknown function [Phycisphaerales bacterium]
MNFKTTLILLVLLAVVGAFVAYDKFKGEPDESSKTVATNRLFDVKETTDVNSLTIRSTDGGEIVLTKTPDGKWRMTKPVEAAAENLQVDGLVRDLIDLESHGKIEVTKETGLDKPRFNIEMGAKGGKLLKFAIGEQTQLGDMYVKIEGHDKADVVSSSVYERLAKPANDLRDKQLITAASPAIRQMVIEADGQPKLVLHKSGEQWALAEPVKLPVDEAVITDLLGAVTNLRATDWIAKDSPELANAKFEKPQMTVAFTTEAPSTQPATATGPSSQPAWTTITFGQYDTIRHLKLFARISDTNAVVKVASTPLETLSKKPIDLRDKKVLDLMPEQVSKLSIVTDLPAGAAPTTRPAKKTEVAIERRKQLPATQAAATTRATTQPATTQASTTPATKPVVAEVPKPLSTWELKTDPKGDADDEQMRNLLADLHPLRAAKYLEATPATKPVGNYVVKVTTEGPGGTPVVGYELKLIDPGGDRALMAEYNGLSFELPRTFLTRIEGNFAKKAKVETARPINPDDAGFELPGK